jgi:hypothetical protein
MTDTTLGLLIALASGFFGFTIIYALVSLIQSCIKRYGSDSEFKIIDLIIFN